MIEREKSRSYLKIGMGLQYAGDGAGQRSERDDVKRVAPLATAPYIISDGDECPEQKTVLYAADEARSDGAEDDSVKAAAECTEIRRERPEQKIQRHGNDEDNP